MRELMAAVVRMMRFAMPKPGILFFALAVLCPYFDAAPMAFNGNIEIAAGYDDNAESLPDGRGSGFIMGRFALTEPLTKGTDIHSADLYARGGVQDYFRLKDRYFGTFGASANREAMDGLFSGVLFCETSFYRDGLIPEDDFDGFSAGAAASVLIAPSTEMTVGQFFSWRDFKEKVSLTKQGKPGPGDEPDDGQGKGPGKGGFENEAPGGPPSHDVFFEKSRDDHSFSTELSLTAYLGPSFTARLTGEHSRNGSSVRKESFHSNGLFIDLKWSPGKNWMCALSLSAEKFDFDRDGRQRRRIDKVWNAGARISRQIEKFELYFEFDATDADSTFAIETYKRTVTQCGVVWSF